MIECISRTGCCRHRRRFLVKATTSLLLLDVLFLLLAVVSSSFQLTRTHTTTASWCRLSDRRSLHISRTSTSISFTGRHSKRSHATDSDKDLDRQPPRALSTTTTKNTTSAVDTNTGGSSINYEDSDAASKGLVSSLTNLVNLFASSSSTKSEKTTEEQTSSLSVASSRRPSPTTPKELLQRIRDDYLVNNYLWTGDIDLSAFETTCRFADPTLSFTGTDQFVTNIQNLRPIVDALVGGVNGVNGACRSELLDIRLVRENPAVNEEIDEGQRPHQQYIQTRWNMVGQLSALPWRPKIDVVGRTRFWYRRQAPRRRRVDLGGAEKLEEEEGATPIRVFYYDEEWEIPAWKALLQLVTPT